MKKLLFVCLLLLSNFIFSQTPAVLDVTWDGDGHLVSQPGFAADVLLFQPDGKILAALNPQFSTGDAYLARYNADGTFDTGFASNGKKRIEIGDKRNSIVQMYLHNGNIYIGGSATSDAGGTRTYPYLAALDMNGSYLSSFGTNGVLELTNPSMDLYGLDDFTIGPNGNLWAISSRNLYRSFGLVKVFPSGTVDLSFNTAGMANINSASNDEWIFAKAIEFDKNGQIVVAGYVRAAQNVTPNYKRIAIFRFITNGILENAWGNNGRLILNTNAAYLEDADDLEITAGNDYVVAGNSFDGSEYSFVTMKVDDNGILDPSFGGTGWVLSRLGTNIYSQLFQTLQLLPDQSLLHVGNVSYGDTVRFAALMLNPDGSRNQTFAPNGLLQTHPGNFNNSSATGLALNLNGRMAMGGFCRTCQNGNCGPLYTGISMFNVTFAPPVSVAPAQTMEIACSPNPIRPGQHLRISGIAPNQIEEITLTNLSGKTVPVSRTSAGFTLPELASGLYFCQIRTPTDTRVRKIIVD